MPKKKKILFAITKGNWGGAQRYVFDLATNLSTDQFDVAVVCGQGERLKTKLQEKDIRTISIPNLGRDLSLINDIKSGISLFKIFKLEQPDIVHLNSSKIGGLGSLAARLAGVPKIIFTGHGWAWNEDRSYFSKVLITLSYWLTALMCHQIIAVSEKTKKEIARLPFISGSKIKVIYNGISDTEYFERFAARSKLNNQISEKFWVGTISELHHNKGLDILIDAFADISKTHPDAALHIIGEGQERQALTLQIENLGLTKKIHLLGFVDNARIFLKAFDVFVLSSRTEAFPYVPLEAGLAQLPMVATRVGGVPEIVADGKNGLLVAPSDKKGLSEAIKKLLENSSAAATLGHNLRKTVEEKFLISSMVENTKAVYN